MGLSNANGWQNMEGMYKNGMASVSISCSTCRIKVSVLSIFIYLFIVGNVWKKVVIQDKLELRHVYDNYFPS